MDTSRHVSHARVSIPLPTCLLSLITMLVMAALPHAALPQQTDDLPVLIGTVSGQLDSQDAFSPFATYLGQALPGHTFEVIGFDSIERLMAAVENEDLDFAFISPAAYVELTIDSNLRLLSTITQPVGDTYSPWLAGAVFTLDSRNDIETMIDVRGKRVVALSEIALGGWLSAQREWRDLGVNTNAEFASLDFVFSYSEVVDRVCTGEADIGVIAANTLSTYQVQCNEPLKVLPQPGTQDITYDIPHSTRLYPEVAFVMVGNQNEEFIRLLTRALLEIEHDSPIAQSVNVCGFTAPLPYAEVRALMEELRIGPWRSLGRLTLQQLLLDNIFLVTLAMLLLMALILGGFINAHRLSRRFRESERYRNLLFESSHIPMVVVDPQSNTFLDMNPAAVHQYGYNHKRELIGKPVTAVSDHEEESSGKVELEIARTQQEVFRTGNATFEWPHIRPNGDHWIANIHLMTVDSPSGKLIQATVEDITQQRLNEKEHQDLEQQLAFSQRMESIGRLAGGIAHDFNNLLTIINGYCEVLLLETGDSSKSAKILQQIRKAGIRASELTQQLLTFSRRQAIRQVPINVNRIIMDSSEMIRSVLGDDIRLKLDLTPDECTVLSDPGQLQQVLINLVVNAKDAMPDGGVLEISTSEIFITPRDAQGLEINAGDYIEITVRDNGVGMSQGILQHIFEPFFTTKDNSGTGLGLSTVYGIVQQSLGTISVTSTEGEGSEFRVLLPRSEETETRNDADANPVPTELVDTGTILVVEDQVEVLDYATSVLRKSGYQVHTATSGSEALATMEALTEPVHLLITDVVMEGMSGGELAEIFSERYQDIPVLFISGYPGDELARYGVRQGTREFLAKPFTPQQLLERVDQILKNAPVMG